MTHGKRLLIITGIFGAVMGGMAVAQAAMNDADMKSAVTRHFDDPYSAQFKDIRRVENGFCGKVNAKNRMGAYVGYEDFYVERLGSMYMAHFRRGAGEFQAQAYAEACS